MGGLALGLIGSLPGQAPHALTPAEQRKVDGLVARMTAEEKLDYIGGTGFAVRAVPTLHLPALEMSDGPFGTRSNVGFPSTTYAAGIGLAASWDRALATRVGAGIGRDARARGVDFMLGPGVNIYRDPRNGRNFEYLGEDPFLAANIATGYITGMQKEGVSATVKHFLGNNSEFLLARVRRAGLGAAFVLLTIAAALWVKLAHGSALDQLWTPILATGRPVLFCLPTGAGNKTRQAAYMANLGSAVGPSAENAGFGGGTLLDHLYMGENVVFSDVLATLKIADLLAIHHREYRVKLHTSTSLDDLRQGPAILIGGLDNPWTMRAVTPLRYHFAGSDEDRYWIAAAQHPAQKNWSLDIKSPYLAIKRDYALIARVHNDQTGQPEMIVAGIGMSGTAAAGEFLVDPGKLEELRRRVGAGFKDHDFEAVLSTDVVNGIAGSPKILAVSVW